MTYDMQGRNRKGRGIRAIAPPPRFWLNVNPIIRGYIMPTTLLIVPSRIFTPSYDPVLYVSSSMSATPAYKAWSQTKVNKKWVRAQSFRHVWVCTTGVAGEGGRRGVWRGVWRQAVVGVCIVLVERARTSSISLYDIGTAKVIHIITKLWSFQETYWTKIEITFR